MNESLRTDFQRQSPAQIRHYKDRLKCWMTLGEANSILEEISEIAGPFVTGQGDLKFVREVSVGKICGALLHAERIRLCDDPPDFMLDFGQSNTIECEVVGVIPGNRRVREEHKKIAEDMNSRGTTSIRLSSHTERQAENEAVVDDVAIQVAAKATKSYCQNFVLVVDIDHDLQLQSDIGQVNGLVKIGREALDSFREIWFLKNRELLRVSAQSVSLIIPPWPFED